MDSSTMHPKIERYSKITDIIFNDPFSTNTHKTRLALIIASSFAILVRIYHLKMTETPLLHLKIPPNTPDILSGALSVITAYLLVVFLFFAWQDYRRWKCGVDIITLQTCSDLLLNTRNDTHNIKYQVEKFLSDPAQQKQYPDFPFDIPKLNSIVNEVLSKIPENQKKIEKLYKDNRVLSIAQWIRLTVIDIGTPLFIGVIAVFKSYSAIIPFIKAIF